MARIPIFTRQQGIDAPAAPQVRLSGAVAAGGALAGVGDKIASLGSTAQGLAEHMRMRQEQEDKFQAGIEDDARRAEQAQAFEEARRKAAEDGSGFHDNVMQVLDETAGKRFANIRNPEQRARLEARWQQVERTTWATRAASEETGLKSNFQRKKISEVQNGLIAEIGQNPDPDTAEAVYQRGLERINNASALTSAERADLAKRWEQAARTAELQKRFAGDPDGMRKVLGIVQGDGGKPVPENIRSVIQQAAEKHGVPVSAMLYTADRESKFNPQAKNPNSSAAGLFQFINSTRKQYGNFDPYDPAASADAAARLMRDNRDILKRELGRDPTDGELYLAHQQGAAGAAALLKNPNASVASIVGEEAARLNGGAGLTAAQFARKWTETGKYAYLDNGLKDRLIRGAETESRVEARKIENLMVDDINSIRMTGQPVQSLDVQEITRRLGPERAAEHIREREREARFFEATSDFDTLPNDAIRARVDGMKPKGGSPGFTEEQKNFEDIQKRGEAVIRNRLADPAASVDALDIVREARGKIQYEGEGQMRRIAPQSAQAIVQARLRAQESLGIERPYAVTRKEASTLARQLRQIGEDNEPGVQQFLDTMKRTYGDFAPVVLQSMLELENVNRELSSAATRVMTDVMRARIPDISSIRQLDANIAWKDEASAGGSALAGMAGRNAQQPAATQAPARPGATFDPQDLRWLWENRMDKTARDEFNLRYPGQADTMLKDLERRFGASRNGR